MKGAYRISVSTKRIKYDFTINRNITIIQGDSGTGKTTLVGLIRRFYEQGSKSGVKLECDRVCMPLGGRDWYKLLDGVHDTIVFIDEGNAFVKSNDFARAAKASDNYYVIVTREALGSLPISVNEIYGIRSNGKMAENVPVYNSMYRLYGEFAHSTEINPTLVITEDSNAGHDFFSEDCAPLGIACISAHGRDKITDYIYSRPGDAVLIIADGAAYGSKMRETCEYLKEFSNYVLYLPESFEWLLLASGILKERGLKDILKSPCKYIESSEFFSWERFFTHLLEKLTEENPVTTRYNKQGRLPPFFRRRGNIDKVLGQIPSIKFKDNSV